MENFITYELHEWVNVDKVNWDILSCNPNAIHILEKNLDKVECVMKQIFSRISILQYEFI